MREQAEQVFQRPRPGHGPPERFHVFVSYTTREREVQLVKPTVDLFLISILRPMIEQALGELPVFYDGYTLHSINRKRYALFGEDGLLRRALKFAIEESELLIAFISPQYVESEWCRFECETMASKEPRLSWDVCRVPPIEELRDERPADLRPGWLDCLYARWLRRFGTGNDLRSLPEATIRPILPVVWSADRRSPAELVETIPSLRARQWFDWRHCVTAAEASERVFSHLSVHGSVSPSGRAEAVGLSAECSRAMTQTAEAVTRILLQRRLMYCRLS